MRMHTHRNTPRRRETMRDIAHKYERINARKQLQQRMAQSVKDKNRDEFIQRAAWKEEMEVGEAMRRNPKLIL